MKKIKKTAIWIILIAAAAAVGFVIYKNKSEKTEYSLVPVNRGVLTQTISADGKYLSKDEASVSFRLSGPLTGIKVDVGDKVKKGQLLASVDTGTLTEKLEQAQKAVTVQKKTLDYQKDKDDLYTKDQRGAQKAAVQQAEAAVSEILEQFRYANINAPISGTIAEKNVNIGEMVQAGNPVIKIIQEDEMRVEAKIPEVDISGVRVGQKVSLKFDAYPDNQRFEGIISEIDPTSVVINNVSYYTAKVNVDNPDSNFKHGMNCTMYDITNQKNDVLIIPKEVIIKEGDKKFVTVLTDVKNNTVEKREIKTGLEGDGGMVEVVSGLKEGDKIATLK